MDPGGLSLDGAVALLDLAASRRVPLVDGATLARIDEALEAAARAGTRSLVIAGGRHGTFAAGADLHELARLEPLEALAFARRGQQLFDRMEAAPFVVIAAVRGRCIGGAFDLVMACDLRLAEPASSFSHPGPRLGFITGYGGTSRLPLIAGRAAADVLAGRVTLDAAAALSLGLVAEVHTGPDLDGRAMTLAREIAEVPADRIALVKEALRRLRASGGRRRLERALVSLARAAARPAE